MKLRKLTYSEIDFDKYTACLRSSEQYITYAEKEYLDSVSTLWEVVVWEDYRAIMPIPFVMKMGFKIVIMPMLCQQLGVFSNTDEVEINEAFLSFLNKEYYLLNYNFNVQNRFKTKLILRPNFVINKNDYQEVLKNYRKSRKQAMRNKARGRLILKTEFLEQEYSQFLFKNIKGAKHKKKNKLWNIIQNLVQKGYYLPYAFYMEEKLQTLLFVLKGERSVYQILQINTKGLRHKNNPAFAVDTVIQQFICEKNFDFEGSAIPSVSNFNRSFGATEYFYPVILNSKIKLIKSLFFK